MVVDAGEIILAWYCDVTDLCLTQQFFHWRGTESKLSE